MSDKYLEMTRSGPLAAVAKKLGLPRPAKLRRTDPAAVDTPLVPGPVLVLADEGSAADATMLAEGLLDWDLDVRRDTRLPEHERWGAVILVLTGLTHPTGLSAPALELGSTLRQLAPSARVITLSRSAPAPAPSPEGVAPALAAARHGVDGFLRTAAKEMRSGTTANGLVLAEGVEVDAPSVRGGLRFLLSARSAFVDGQLIAVGSTAGAEPQDWVRPLTGAVAVVTGAARGIGAEVVAVLARDGAQVIGVDVPAAGEALAKTMNQVGGAALHLDITAEDAAERILELARARYGRLDIVVHNAGILRDKTLARMTADRFDSLLAVNISAPLRMNETFAGQLGGEGFAPRIISLASTSGIAGNRGQSNYAAAKSGIIGMTRSLAGPMAARGGTANAVAPGFIETDMTASIPPVPRQVARWSSSLQQGGQPVDVAETIAFLASPQAGGINGQTVRVCGQLMVGQ